MSLYSSTLFKEMAHLQIGDSSGNVFFFLETSDSSQQGRKFITGNAGKAEDHTWL